MSDTRQRTGATRFPAAEDFALQALVAIERAWGAAHSEGELPPDRWGEGPSRLRLADLGLDARILTHALVGLCHRHGEFALEWAGRVDEEPPDFVRCTSVSDGQRCTLDGPVARAPRIGGSAR